jgi:hypothetical protein
MAPPENAIVICVDEKPSIQALERAQGYLKLPNGRALTGHIHNYTRNGTTTLFAALEVATGQITVAHKKRRRRVEFLEFMNQIVADFSRTDTAIHVILDNLSTHKPSSHLCQAAAGFECRVPGDDWVVRGKPAPHQSAKLILPSNKAWGVPIDLRAGALDDFHR